MRKYIISIMVVLVSLFFINSKANFKYDVNYFTVNRHMEELIGFESDEKEEYIRNYIFEETTNYNVEVVDNVDYIIVNKQSENSNAKNIAFVTHFNGLTNNTSVNNSALPISTMLSSIRAYNKYDTSNNISFVFLKNPELTLDGNMSFLNKHSELNKKFDYTFSFDTRGTSGDLYIYSTTENNESIIDFYKQNVTSVSGSSDLSNVYNKSKVKQGESLSFSTFENAHSYFSDANTLKILNENTVNKYTNTMDELVKGAHTYEFIDDDQDMVFFNYLDSLVVLDSVAISVLVALSFIALIAYYILFKVELNIKNIALATVLSFSIIIFALVISMLPLQEFLDRFTQTPLTNFNTKILYVKNNLVFIVVLASTIAYGIIISEFSKIHSNLTFKENIISSCLLLVIFNIASIIMFNNLNVIFSIIFILNIILLYLMQYLKLSTTIIQIIFMVVVIPIITHSLFLMYIIATPARISYFALLLGVYLAIALPIIAIEYKQKLVQEKHIQI